MKKFAIALAVLPAAAAVHAQSNVTLYGLVDAGVEWVNHASATGDSVTRLTSGGMNTSRWGIRGNEDLGGGLKALFQLESGIAIDTGTNSTLFGRQANVGLEGGFGRLIVGRSFTTSYDFILPFDPMGYAPVYSWATSGHGSSPANIGSKFPMDTAANNLLKYQGQFGGFKVGATYSFGEQAGSTTSGSKYHAGVGYNVGPFAAALTYERVNAAAPSPRNETDTYHFGVSFQAAKDLALKVGGRHHDLDRVGSTNLRANTYWIGANYQAMPALNLTAALYYQDERVAADSDPKMLVLRAKYALSKRTDLYATAAYARAESGQPVSLSRDSAAEGSVSGFRPSQTGTMVGVQHRF